LWDISIPPLHGDPDPVRWGHGGPTGRRGVRNVRRRPVESR
jgi:hypothetical protein